MKYTQEDYTLLWQLAGRLRWSRWAETWYMTSYSDVDYRFLPLGRASSPFTRGLYIPRTALTKTP